MVVNEHGFHEEMDETDEGDNDDQPIDVNSDHDVEENASSNSSRSYNLFKDLSVPIVPLLQNSRRISTTFLKF